ncbi:hypothetical protein NM208_g15559 [Fusarium decemcellulare]|uniref:Uncharacterized protein n=1 Tax=Fusarium decemcellulare TaxID=57161 RepID=A0ACC1RCN7_9HYPO|nr:hypothetical protein NM208_g15559 [Fusarium decemcellulare]
MAADGKPAIHSSQRSISVLSAFALLLMISESSVSVISGSTRHKPLCLSRLAVVSWAVLSVIIHTCPVHTNPLYLINQVQVQAQDQTLDVYSSSEGEQGTGLYPAQDPCETEQAGSLKQMLIHGGIVWGSCCWIDGPMTVGAQEVTSEPSQCQRQVQVPVGHLKLETSNCPVQLPMEGLKRNGVRGGASTGTAASVAKCANGGLSPKSVGGFGALSTVQCREWASSAGVTPLVGHFLSEPQWHCFPGHTVTQSSQGP